MILVNWPTPETLYKSALLLALIVLIFTSWHAPMSGDEYVHVKQAEKNISYILSLGAHREALDTPISRLKHYGQSFDTVTTFIAQTLDLRDIYRFRHVSNAIVAWLTILFASLIAGKISKSKVAACFTVILFLVSLRFMGHAMNNLKDIPFAFAFTCSIYFMLRFLEKLPKISWFYLALLTMGLAFGISIRIGGLLIFAYFLLFTGLYLYFQIISGKLGPGEATKLGLKIGLLSISVFALAYICAMLLWPWALEDPFKNPWISLDLMHHYPTTVRQVFEGKLIWSDRFPWYYLFKYMLVTLPLLLFSGLVAGMMLIWKSKDGNGILYFVFNLIAFGFPLFYASVSGANVYGGWRQMLFVFPPLAVVSGVGMWLLLEVVKGKKIWKSVFAIVFGILLYGPIRFFVANYPYQYIFFNQFAGGIKGAYVNYELDYYFTSFKKAYEYIDQESGDRPEIVAANFIIQEYYKGKPYRAKLIDYYDRSSVDWDYAVICKTFLEPHQARHGYWPPLNTVYVEEIDGKPILAVLKRGSKLDLEGKKDLDQGLYHAAIRKLESALADDKNNESVRLNLARAYQASGDYSGAQSVLDYFKKLYPTNEWANEIRGEIELKQGNVAKAIQFFEKNIDHNYKFLHSYINLAKAMISMDRKEDAISQLKTCLRINPFYTPAYKLYGKILIERGDVELGEKMLRFSIDGEGKYGGK
ncbi:MAG: tetratricopeptide repeat protein [Cytophagales bacterium]|nr:tetratricopeptide repeat protein [Cytophagales bacterium]